MMGWGGKPLWPWTVNIRRIPQPPPPELSMDLPLFLQYYYYYFCYDSDDRLLGWPRDTNERFYFPLALLATDRN